MADSERLQAIKDKLDAWIGIKGELKPSSRDPENNVELHYQSPNNVLLVIISFQWYRGEWHLGSRSAGLPTGIDHLRKLVEPQTDEEKLDSIFQTS
jgi:hypothetical protein